MKWGTRLVYAYRALRGGAPPSKERKRGTWTRPASTLTGWDAMMSDSAVMSTQLRSVKRERDRLEDELEDLADEIDRYAGDVENFADWAVDEGVETEIEIVAEALQDHARFARQTLEEEREGRL